MFRQSPLLGIETASLIQYENASEGVSKADELGLFHDRKGAIAGKYMGNRTVATPASEYRQGAHSDRPTKTHIRSLPHDSKFSVLTEPLRRLACVSSRQSSPQDCPLWKVECQVGREREVVFNALSQSKQGGALSAVCSAFVVEPIKGFVFVEADLTQGSLDFLKNIPGIIMHNGARGIHATLVPVEEMVEILQMEALPRAGDWVQVLAGMYHDDVGVLERINQGKAEVWLVPRMGGSSLGKRKPGSAAIPPPILFDAEAVRRVAGQASVFDVDPDKGRYLCRERFYERGLILHILAINSITSRNVSISWVLWNLIKSTEHPRVPQSRMPRVREWQFRPGELVIHAGNARPAMIWSVQGDGVGVKYTDGAKEFTTLGWADFYRKWDLGDFVKLATRPCLGSSGRVERAEGANVRVRILPARTQSEWIRDLGTRREASDSFSDTLRAWAEDDTRRVETMDCHANSLRCLLESQNNFASDSAVHVQSAREFAQTDKTMFPRDLRGVLEDVGDNANTDLVPSTLWKAAHSARPRLDGITTGINSDRQNGLLASETRGRPFVDEAETKFLWTSLEGPYIGRFARRISHEAGGR